MNYVPLETFIICAYIQVGILKGRRKTQTTVIDILKVDAQLSQWDLTDYFIGVLTKYNTYAITRNGFMHQRLGITIALYCAVCNTVLSCNPVVLKKRLLEGLVSYKKGTFVDCFRLNECWLIRSEHLLYDIAWLVMSHLFFHPLHDRVAVQFSSWAQTNLTTFFCIKLIVPFLMLPCSVLYQEGNQETQ